MYIISLKINFLSIFIVKNFYIDFNYLRSSFLKFFLYFNVEYVYVLYSILNSLHLI